MLPVVKTILIAAAMILVSEGHAAPKKRAQKVSSKECALEAGAPVRDPNERVVDPLSQSLPPLSILRTELEAIVEGKFKTKFSKEFYSGADATRDTGNRYGTSRSIVVQMVAHEFKREAKEMPDFLATALGELTSFDGQYLPNTSIKDKIEMLNRPYTPTGRGILSESHSVVTDLKPETMKMWDERRVEFAERVKAISDATYFAIDALRFSISNRVRSELYAKNGNIYQRVLADDYERRFKSEVEGQIRILLTPTHNNGSVVEELMRRINEPARQVIDEYYGWYWEAARENSLP